MIINKKSVNDSSKYVLPCLNAHDPKKDPIFNQTQIVAGLFRYFIPEFYDCSICLGYSVTPYRINPCKHIFCLRCIKIWMKTSSKCPLCRGTILKIIKI